MAITLPLGSCGDADGGVVDGGAVDEGAETLGNVLAVAAGALHACALRIDGAAFCWGRNDFGQLGQGENTPAFSTTPLRAAPDLAFASISAGEYHTCAVAASSELYCWGDNALGESGGPEELAIVGPTLVAASFARVSAGLQQSCGIDLDGIAWCWGTMTLGDGNASQTATSPVRVIGGPWQSIGAGTNATCAVDALGALYCWANSFGAAAGLVGNGETLEQRAPVAVSGALSAVAVTLGTNHACARSAAGELWCWGTNTSGQLGDGTTTSGLVPVAVADDRTWSNVNGGGLATCALAGPDGEAYCWGRDMIGQGKLLVPTAIPTSARFSSIDVGGGHACGITEDQRLWCWGANAFGQLGNGETGAREDPREVVLPP